MEGAGEEAGGAEVFAAPEMKGAGRGAGNTAPSKRGTGGGATGAGEAFMA